MLHEITAIHRLNTNALFNVFYDILVQSFLCDSECFKNREQILSYLDLGGKMFSLNLTLELNCFFLGLISVEGWSEEAIKDVNDTQRCILTLTKITSYTIAGKSKTLGGAALRCQTAHWKASLSCWRKICKSVMA